MNRKRWTKIVSGQVRDCINKHPQWFNTDVTNKETIIRSITKRVVGEIVSRERSVERGNLPTL